jgi:hypothetical protein
VYINDDLFVLLQTLNELFDMAVSENSMVTGIGMAAR